MKKFYRHKYIQALRLLHLTALCLLLAAVSASAQAPAGNITVRINNASLADALAQINRQSGNIVQYKVEEVRKVEKRVTLSGTMTVQKAVEHCLAGTTLSSRVSNGYILVVPSEGQGAGERRMRNVSGRVTSSDGEALPGVAVLIKGSSRGVVTDVAGNFALNIPDDESQALVFTFLGMERREVAVGTRSTLNVVMNPDSKAIEEVVVRGAYGVVQKKSEMVGSAYQLNADKFENMPSLRIDNILDGLVPGIRVTTQLDRGEARTRNRVNIRGEASLHAGGEPLWIVDGVPIYTGENTNMVSGMEGTVSPLSFIDPADIESVTVLKDAVETAIYGADGSNGIILITTKKGRKTDGSPDINASVKFGFGVVDQSTKFKTLNGRQYLTLAKEAWRNAGNDMRYFPYQDNDYNSYSTTDTDWYDQYFGPSQSYQANVSVSGGTERMTNRLALGYYRDEQMTKGNMQQRINASLNTEYKISKKFTAGLKINASYNTNDLFSPGSSVHQMLPIFEPYNNDGTFRLFNYTTQQRVIKAGETNPLTGTVAQSETIIPWVYADTFTSNYVSRREENDHRQTAFSGNLNANIKYEIIDGLALEARFGVDYLGIHEDIYYARTNYAGMNWTRPTADEDPDRNWVLEPVGHSFRAQSNMLTWTNIENLSYKRTFGRHTVSGMLGFEMVNYDHNNIWAKGSGFPNDKIKEIEYAREWNSRSNSRTRRTMSYFGRAAYGYDNRYNATFIYRADGASDFGTHVKWGKFWAAGASWNLHNEAFLDVPFINVLRLKASYGTTGNSRIGSALSYGVYELKESAYYSGVVGAVMTSPANPDLTWETTYKTNVGLSVGLFDRLEVDVEFYNHLTKDLISNVNVSRIIGDTRVYRNVGEIRNRGIEAVISSRNIAGKNFRWSTDLNISANRNTIIKLYKGMAVGVDTSQRWEEGQDKNAWYLVRWAGVDPMDGWPLWYDANGNITRTFDTSNRVPYKSSNPNFTGGMTNTFVWKDFSFSFLVNYVVGGYALSTVISQTLSDGKELLSSNGPVELLDRWRKPGDIASVPRLVHGLSTGAYMNSTRFLYSRTHVRLSNMSVSYNLPSEWAKKARLKGVRLSLIGDNLATWCPRDYPNRNSYKTVMSTYPSSRVFSIKADLTF